MYCARILVRRHKVISEVDMVEFELGPIVNRRYSAVFAAAAGPSLNELGQCAIHAVPSCAAGGGVLQQFAAIAISGSPANCRLVRNCRSRIVLRASNRRWRLALARVFAFDLQNPIRARQNCAGNLRTQTRLRTNHPFPNRGLRGVRQRSSFHGAFRPPFEEPRLIPDASEPPRKLIAGVSETPAHRRHSPARRRRTGRRPSAPS